MHPKSLLLGLVIGAALASGLFLLFGDEIRSTTASATEILGESVGDVGNEIEEAGKKLR